MMNRRGEVHWTFWMVIIAIVVLLVVLDNVLGDKFDLWPGKALSQNIQSGYVGFEDSSVFDNPSFKFFNYIFGQIPSYLINTLGPGSEISAAIVVIAIWTLFFLAFSDIFKLFMGVFSPAVGWIAAALLAIIGANLKLISVIAVYMLTVLAAFGSLAVLFVIGSTFVLFLMFHFGLSDIREKLILRRAEDEALKAVAGGKLIASGADVLAEVAAKAKKVAKKDGMY